MFKKLFILMLGLFFMASCGKDKEEINLEQIKTEALKEAAELKSMLLHFNEQMRGAKFNLYEFNKYLRAKYDCKDCVQRYDKAKSLKNTKESQRLVQYTDNLIEILANENNAVGALANYRNKISEDKDFTYNEKEFLIKYSFIFESLHRDNDIINVFYGNSASDKATVRCWSDTKCFLYALANVGYTVGCFMTGYVCLALPYTYYEYYTNCIDCYGPDPDPEPVDQCEWVHWTECSGASRPTNRDEVIVRCC